MLDAYQLADPFRGGLFFCDVCGTEVVDNTEDVGIGDGGGAAGREDRMQRFNKGTEIIQGLLKKTDEIKFPRYGIFSSYARGTMYLRSIRSALILLNGCMRTRLPLIWLRMHPRMAQAAL